MLIVFPHRLGRKINVTSSPVSMISFMNKLLSTKSLPSSVILAKSSDPITNDKRWTSDFLSLNNELIAFTSKLISILCWSKEKGV